MSITTTRGRRSPRKSYAQTGPRSHPTVWFDIGAKRKTELRSENLIGIADDGSRAGQAANWMANRMIVGAEWSSAGSTVGYAITLSSYPAPLPLKTANGFPPPSGHTRMFVTYPSPFRLETGEVGPSTVAPWSMGGCR